MEPPLREISAAGSLNRQVFDRIARRVDYLISEIKGVYEENEIANLLNTTKSQPPPVAGAPLALDSAYWSTLIQKIESGLNVDASGISALVTEPKLMVPKPPFLIHRAALNRIIRRIEALAAAWGGSGTGINT